MIETIIKLVLPSFTDLCHKAAAEFKDYKQVKAIVEWEAQFPDLYGDGWKERDTAAIKRIVNLYEAGILENPSRWEQDDRNAAERLIRIYQHNNLQIYRVRNDNMLENRLKELWLTQREREVVYNLIKFYETGCIK